MMGVLLESRARRQRRSGGAALSVAAHLVIIGAAVAGTTHSVIARPSPPRVEIVRFATPVAKPPMRQGIITESVLPTLPSNMVVQRVAVPAFTPRGLPAIDMSGAVGADSIIIGGGAPGLLRGTGGAPTILGEGGGDREWSANEVLMHVVTSAKPRYPESLRNANVDGRVLVQFTVDTLGRVDASSIVVLQSTHDLFSLAVKDALVQFRFRPAQVGARRVAATAEMPFEFRISR